MKKYKFKQSVIIFGLVVTLIMSFTACGNNTHDVISNGQPSITSSILSETISEETVSSTTEVDSQPQVETSSNKTGQPSAVTSSSSKEGISDTSSKINQNNTTIKFDLKNVPAFSNKPYYVITNNKPFFSKNDIHNHSFEEYSNLDSLGRCGVTIACVGKDIMPTEKRGAIGMIKPSGWKTIKFDCVDGKYLYNRCHLIGFQLTGENANEKNLITGTRYMNVEGMLPFENMIADYVKETNNHVLYRVTPIYDGNNLVASGVLMEAYSVEDSGSGIEFNVYVYNNQPGISINYLTGDASLLTDKTTIISSDSTSVNDNLKSIYIINKNTKKYHLPSCRFATTISEKNREEFNGVKEDLLNQGYEPCKTCNP